MNGGYDGAEVCEGEDDRWALRGRQTTVSGHTLQRDRELHDPQQVIDYIPRARGGRRLSCSVVRHADSSLAVVAEMKVEEWSASESD